MGTIHEMEEFLDWQRQELFTINQLSQARNRAWDEMGAKQTAAAKLRMKMRETIDQKYKALLNDLNDQESLEVRIADDDYCAKLEEIKENSKPAEEALLEAWLEFYTGLRWRTPKELSDIVVSVAEHIDLLAPGKRDAVDYELDAAQQAFDLGVTYVGSEQFPEPAQTDSVVRKRQNGTGDSQPNKPKK